MMKKKQLTFSLFLILGDAVLIWASFLFSYWLRFISGVMPAPKGIPPFQPYFIASIAVAFLWILIFWMVGLYESRSAMTQDEEIYRVAKGTVVGLVAILAFSFFYREVVWSRLVLGMATMLGFVFLALERAVAVYFYQAFMKKYGLGMKRAALVGNGETAEKLLDIIGKHTEYGYIIHCLVGIDGYCNNTSKEGMAAYCLKNLQELSNLIDEQELDALFIVLPTEKQRQVINVVNAVEHRPVEMKFVPDIIDIISHDTSVSQMGDIPLINLRVLPLTEWDLVIKRIFDLSAAIFGIIILSPLLLILVVLVKLTSAGPVFYTQERVGYDGTTFKMLKFRSMKAGAEEKTGPVWAKPDDDRRTLLGPFLRKYSLDELPQLLNVIKGDMSLVGPRPERPFFVEQFKGQIPRYASRHKMKSGVTGWAQVNGWRGDTSILERTKCDIFYIENWSLYLDIKILIRTALQVIFPRNAY